MFQHKDERELDNEWINLMKEALEMGTGEEVRQFLINPVIIDQLKGRNFRNNK
ncbi:anti-repressor SinI family protein [Alkalihalobacillus sp. NPDC078783]